MAKLQEQAKQAYIQEQKLQAERKAEQDREIAIRIVHELEIWFNITIDPAPAYLPVIMDGLEFTGQLDGEGWVEISFRKVGEDLYDEDFRTGWAHVNNASDIGKALTEHEAALDYIANHKPEDDEASE